MSSLPDLDFAWLVEPAIVAAVGATVLSFGAWAIVRTPDRTPIWRTVFMASTAAGMLFVVVAIVMRLAESDLGGGSELPRPLFLLLSAFIVPLVTIVGWFISSEIARERDYSLRQERVADVERALMAEIESNWLRFELFDLADYETVADEIESEPQYTPFIPREAGSTVFQSIVEHIQILEKNVIRPVVQYYHHFDTLDRFIEDLRSKEYGALTDAERKANMYRDYIEMIHQHREEAETAINALREALGEKRLPSRTAPDRTNPDGGADASAPSAQ